MSIIIVLWSMWSLWRIFYPNSTCLSYLSLWLLFFSLSFFLLCVLCIIINVWAHICSPSCKSSTNDISNAIQRRQSLLFVWHLIVWHSFSSCEESNCTFSCYRRPFITIRGSPLSRRVMPDATPTSPQRPPINHRRLTNSIFIIYNYLYKYVVFTVLVLLSNEISIVPTYTIIIVVVILFIQ